MGRIKNVMVLVSALGVLGHVFAQGPQWHNLYPQYRGLASDGTNIVAVSEDGVILVGDGVTWETQFLRGVPLRAVAYGDGEFVAAAYNNPLGDLFRATNPNIDGATGGGWALIQGSNPEPQSVYHHMIYAGAPDHKFVAAGVDYAGDPLVFKTTEEDNVDARVIGILRNSAATHIAYGDVVVGDEVGRFAVIVGGRINTIHQLDGHITQWTYETEFSANVVAFGGETNGFVALGPGVVVKSPDASPGSWGSTTNTTIPAGLRDLYYAGNNTFVAVGNAGVGVVSTDGGTTWTSATGLSTSDNFIAVRFANDRYVAVGERGARYTSANGVAWTKQAEGRDITYRAFAAGGGVFVAVGDSGISRSTDGRNWDNVADDAGARNLRDVAYGRGRFVAVGLNGTVVSSTDGNTWTASQTPNSTDSLFAVAISPQAYLVGGRDDGGLRVLLSTSSANPTEFFDDTPGPNVGGWQGSAQYPTSLAFGSGRFIAGTIGGFAGNLVAHTGLPENSSAWTRVDYPIENSGEVRGVTYSDGMFVAHTFLGNVSNTMTSETGESGTWTTRGTPSNLLNHVTRGKDHIVAVADNGRMYAMSVNGMTTWQAVATNPGNNLPRATTNNLRTVFFDDGTGTFLAGGDGGTILYSTANPDPIVSVRHPASNARRATAASPRLMRLERGRGAPMIRFADATTQAGSVAVYSLSGRQLYKTQIAAGERSVQLPNRVSNSSVIVRFVGADGTTVSQRFTVLR